MKSDKTNEKYFVLFISISLLIGGCLAIERSLWIDEAMIFVNIKEISFFELFNPLPYYTQASPIVPLAFQKSLYYIFDTNLFLIRLSTLAISVLTIIIFIYNLPKHISKSTWLAVLTTSSYSFLYYSTEIKHYIFEFMASLLLINSYFFYISKNYLKAFLFSIIAITFGFSTIIPMGITIFFILSLKFRRKNFHVNYLKYFLPSIIAIVISYFYMKHLTSIQIKSHDVYLSNGFISDTKKLLDSALVSHGKILTLLTTLSLAFSLCKFNKNITFKNFSLLYIFIIMAVYALKISALYPIIAGKHLIWLLPFSITVCCMFLQNTLLSLNYFKTKTIIVISLITILCITFIDQLKKYARNSEHTANFQLIEKVNAICKKDNVNLISTEWTDRVLNAYKDKIDTNCVISILDPSVKAPYAEIFINKLNLFDKDSQNFLIMSNIDVKRNYDDVKIVSDYYRYDEYITDKRLGYTVYYYNRNVAILILTQQ